VIATLFDLKWRFLQIFYLVDLLLFTSFLALLSTYEIQVTEGTHTNVGIEITFLVIIMVRFVIQAVQGLVHPRIYLSDLKNYLELAISLFSFLMVFAPVSKIMLADFMTFTIWASWLNFFYYLRYFETLDIGLYILMF